jgi:glycosyltransferase involved in cell wall biosynthesis
MKFCVLIPCFNHVTTIGEVARAARAHCPVVVVDDGSTRAFPALEDCALLRLEGNRGKAAALRAGFAYAAQAGFTHVITMDADGQHFTDDVPRLMAAARAQPRALALGQRDFRACGAPPARRHANALAAWWFYLESGVRLTDTQCGFRCYPLALAQRLQTRAGRFAFELEFLVRAGWVETPLAAVPVRCVYHARQLRESRFRPVADLARITMLTAGLGLQSCFVPRSWRAAWSLGKQTPWRAAFGLARRPA